MSYAGHDSYEEHGASPGAVGPGGVREPNAMLAHVPFPGYWCVIACGPGVEELGPFGTKEEARAAAVGRGYVLA